MVELKVKGYSYAYGNYGENKPEVYAFPEEEVREWARAIAEKLYCNNVNWELCASMVKYTSCSCSNCVAYRELSRLAEGKEKGARGASINKCSGECDLCPDYKRCKN